MEKKFIDLLAALYGDRYWKARKWNLLWWFAFSINLIDWAYFYIRWESYYRQSQGFSLALFKFNLLPYHSLQPYTTHRSIQTVMLQPHSDSSLCFSLLPSHLCYSRLLSFSVWSILESYKCYRFRQLFASSSLLFSQLCGLIRTKRNFLSCLDDTNNRTWHWALNRASGKVTAVSMLLGSKYGKQPVRTLIYDHRDFSNSYGERSWLACFGGHTFKVTTMNTSCSNSHSGWVKAPQARERTNRRHQKRQ